MRISLPCCPPSGLWAASGSCCICCWQADSRGCPGSADQPSSSGVVAPQGQVEPRGARASGVEPVSISERAYSQLRVRNPVRGAAAVPDRRREGGGRRSQTGQSHECPFTPSQTDERGSYRDGASDVRYPSTVERSADATATLETLQLRSCCVMHLEGAGGRSSRNPQGCHLAEWAARSDAQSLKSRV